VDREPITVSFVIRDLPALHHIMRFTLYHKPLVIASDDGAAEVQFPRSLAGVMPPSHKHV